MAIDGLRLILNITPLTESSEPTMTLTSNETIHEVVRSHYGARARNVAGSCCGPTAADTSCCSTENSSCCEPTLYSSEELQLVPADAANISLGCGNPTAIAALRTGEVVLDLGSGGGIDVFLAAKQVGSTGFVYGVDMTEEMLALARRNAAKHGIENVEFLQGHIEQIPLPDTTVDVIISNCVINLSPDKGQTLQEAFRVLKAGGRLAVSDIVVDGTLADLPISETQIRAALSWAGCIAGALTIEQYTTLLTATGFVEIQVDIRHRYTLAEVGQDAPPELFANLPVATVENLVNRFTSCAISAQRPV